MGQFISSSISNLRNLVSNRIAIKAIYTQTLAVLAVLLFWSLSVFGATAPLSKVSCGSTSFTGASTDLCSVYLATATTSSVNVTLSSSNAAVSVPSAVTVSAGRSTTGFSATVSSVGKGVTVLIKAKVGTASKTFSIQLNPVVAKTSILSINHTSMAFGDVDINTSATALLTLASTGTAPVTVSGAAVTGTGFSIVGTKFPLTLNPGQTATLDVEFDPSFAGSATGQLSISSNSSSASSTTVSLSGIGKVSPALGSLSCTNGSMTGAGTDACTIALTAPAPAGGFNIRLTSSVAAIAVPATVTIPANASTVAFSATISSLSTSQASTLTATAAGVSRSFVIQLNATTATLSVSATSLNFGNVAVNTPATSTLSLSSTGTAPVTINAATLAGAGFTISGEAFPLVLAPNQSAILTVQFNPTSAGSANGTLSIATNSSTNPATIVSLSGTGTSLSSVACSAAAVTSAGPIACTLTLSGAAPAGGLNVNVSSSSAEVTVPSPVMVQPNAAQAGFTATVSAFSSTQAATLTATAGIASQTFTIQLTVSTASYIYVDATRGSDSGAGTADSPLKTIQAAVTKANASNKRALDSMIIVNPGVYREVVNISNFSGQTGASLTIQAAIPGSAIIAGSDVISNWTSESGNPSIYSSPWQYRFGACAIPSGWPVNIEPIALRTEMLFVNNEQLTQVMAASDLQPGTFYVDEANSLLHAYPPAGTNMQIASIEAAVRANTLNVYGRSNVTVRGLVFRHSNSCINRSSANISASSNVLVDQVQALWNSWGGLGVYSSTGVTVQNSIASHNGGVGFVSNQDQNSLYNFNESDYNNWRGAQAAFYEWAMGGTKLFAMHGATVQNHFSFNNQGEGLWFDTDNKNIVVDNATLVGNTTAALQIERNEGPVTLQNSHLCSSGVGVNLLTSEKVAIKNNTFYNNGGTNKYQAQIYLAGQSGGINITDWQTGQVYDLFTTGLVLSGNSFEDGAPGQNLFGTYVGNSDWTSFAASLNSSNNSWYDSSTPTSFKIVNGKLVNLAGWQNAVGTDFTSDWSPSSSSAIAACALPAPTYIDFQVNVDSGRYTMKAGQAVATVHVNSFGAGAVALSVTGLPQGVKAVIGQPTLVSGVTTVTLSASAGAATQTVPITLWGADNGRVHTVTFQLAVAP